MDSARRDWRRARSVKWIGRLLHWGRPVALAVVLASCGRDTTAPAPEALGGIKITVRTEGGDLDLDGYILTLDGVEHTRVAISQLLEIPDLTPTAHTIGLTDVAENCLVAGENPRTVTILPGPTLETLFDVDCYVTGVLVSVTQSGADLDEDGFTVSVDDGPPISVPEAEPRLISRLTPGEHTVTLGGVADNCADQGGATRSVFVSPRTTEPLAYLLHCQAVTGFLEVLITTTGEDDDLDGYGVTVGTLPEHPVSPNDSIMIAKLAPGSHTVRLGRIDPHCSTVGIPERTVTVDVGAITRVTFEVSCARWDAIVFQRLTENKPTVWVVRTDGLGARQVAEGRFPVWAPDGRRLALMQEICPPYYYYYYDPCTYELVTMTLGSSTPSTVVPIPWGTFDWSPDGGSMVISRAYPDTAHLNVVDVTGAPANAFKQVVIAGFTGVAEHPAWSPDGTRFAFTCWFDSRPDICVVNANGTGLQRLTNHPENDSRPAWSPDGTHLAFVTERGHPGGPTIAIIAADGSGFREITDGMDPAWSPNGTRLVVRKVGVAPGLYLVNVDGSGVVRLTTDHTDTSPAWRP